MKNKSFKINDLVYVNLAIGDICFMLGKVIATENYITVEFSKKEIWKFNIDDSKIILDETFGKSMCFVTLFQANDSILKHHFRIDTYDNAYQILKNQTEPLLDFQHQ